MEDHLFCGIGVTELGLENVGMERKGDMECACPILYNTRETQAAHPSQEHNNTQESGLDLDGALHNPIFNY